MPEIAINKHDDARVAENEIGAPRQVTTMLFGHESGDANQFGNRQLRFCTLAPYTTHQCRSLLRTHDVAALYTVWS